MMMMMMMMIWRANFQETSSCCLQANKQYS